MLNKAPAKRSEFEALQKHYAEIKDAHMKDMFANDPARFEKFSVSEDGILLDYSKHRITEETASLLFDLAKACDVEGARDQMFSGATVNATENRPALHVALRGSADKNLSVDGENVSKFVDETLQKIKNFSDKVRKEKKFTDIVNIGIGGSDLGTRATYEALLAFTDGPKVHFVGNIDSAALAPLLKTLKPETTLFIAVSKSFTTMETLVNAQTAREWLTHHLDDEAVENHFIAVTENTQEAQKFGIKEDHIFPLRKWIGGRYSIWGSVGLPVAIGIGFENFQKFLDGAKAMDTHFRKAPLNKNLPVILGMLGVWYRNFFDFRAHAIIPYAESLRNFHGHLQQVDMESNGKSVTLDGGDASFATAPVIFGEPGTNAQHAFFQALHQGTDIIPCDFILIGKASYDLKGHHNPLNANALAQSKGLMRGRIDKKNPHRSYEGNRPSSTLILDQLDPYHLGMLLALYEHKTFVQGIVWNINSFDQWGVELGKNLSEDIIQSLDGAGPTNKYDSSTQGLIKHLKKLS